MGDLLFSAGGESVGAVVPSWSDMVLVVPVRSSVMCTPRNLVLLTLSTVELSMVSGGVVSGVPPPEVHHNLLCLLHI